MSPCNASPAFIKFDGEPVLEKVAETFFAIWPDLPIPSVIILPFVLISLLHTSLKFLSKVLDSSSIPLASIFKVLLADLRWFIFYIN